jgi:alpha-D-xyloside xylohydrolase
VRSLVLALVAGGIALTTAGTAWATPSQLTWTVDPSPFRLTFSERGNVLLRERLGPPGAGSRLGYRIREGGAMGTLTRLLESTPVENGMAYRVATTESDRIATVTVTRTSRGLRVGVDLGRGSSTVRTVYESFASVADEHFLGLGEQREAVDLAGRILPVKVWHGCGAAKVSPFFASSRAYGIRFETTAVGRMAFGAVADEPGCQLGTAPCEIAAGVTVIQACFKTRSFAYHVYSGPPEHVVRQVAAQTGRPRMPDPSQFALMKWRDSVDSEAELLDDAARFAAARIPLGWLILDNPWESGACVGSLEFDSYRYPDPAQLVRRVHAYGVRLMLWVSPMVRTVCGRGFYPQDRVFGPDEAQAIDLTDPAVAASFEQRLVNALRSGVDGLKVDRGDEVDFELRSLAGGSGDELHNTYPVLLAASVDRAVRKARGRAIPTIFRAGAVGAQRLETGSWSGDLPGTWAGLEGAVRSAQTAGLAGYSTWGSDVGGYASAGLTPDVFTRWTQLGAVSPVFEVGGDGPNARPWLLGRPAMDALRSAAVLHYELFPYHYQLARVATLTGLPILRPLALSYPDDPAAWKADKEILVGRDLLAVPVTSAGTTASVTLPAGSWVDLTTSATVLGPQVFQRATPMSELPLYLRAGAAIPYNLRSPGVWPVAWDRNDLFRDRRGGWLLAPDRNGAKGTSADYGSITARGGKRMVIVLKGARDETQVLVLGNRIPTSVTIDGTIVRDARRASTLRRMRRGWLVKAAPTGGVLLKLAPRGGRSTVVVDYGASGLSSPLAAGTSTSSQK